MFEAFAVYGQMAPWTIAALLFPCGLVVGSFCTVLQHRIPRGESVVWPASHCPTCHHSLGLVDLVPLLSYVAFRGRCRHCRTSIPARYLLLELTTGVAGAATGFFGGWLAGFSCLMLCVAIVTFVSRPLRRSGAGFTLVEVLVAMSLLVVAAVPMLDLSAELHATSAYQRQLALAVAKSKLEELGYEMLNSSNTSYPVGGHDYPSVGPLTFYMEWTVGSVSPPSQWLRQAVVTVRCEPAESCGGASVSLKAILSKEPID